MGGRGWLCHLINYDTVFRPTPGLLNIHEQLHILGVPSHQQLKQKIPRVFNIFCRILKISFFYPRLDDVFWKIKTCMFSLCLPVTVLHWNTDCCMSLRINKFISWCCKPETCLEGTEKGMYTRCQPTPTACKLPVLEWPLTMTHCVTGSRCRVSTLQSKTSLES